jgi:hypothetical protein
MRYELYEDAPLGKQILTHILPDEELDRIKKIVEHHNKQVDELETDKRIVDATKKIQEIMELLKPHVKSSDYRFKNGSPSYSIYKAYWELSSLLNDFQ